MSSRNPASGSSKPSRLQGLCALIGLTATLVVVSVLGRSVLVDTRPPDLTVESEAFRKGAGGWIVEVMVVNGGDLTAAAVEIEGVAGDETASTTLDYVPGRGSKAAVLVFDGDERPRPTLRVLGWSSP